MPLQIDDLKYQTLCVLQLHTLWVLILLNREEQIQFSKDEIMVLHDFLNEQLNQLLMQ
jgi:hypothetical protein